jgi:uncharacterized membrane protein YhhN
MRDGLTRRSAVALIAASVGFGLAYPLARDLGAAPPILILVKGAAVGLLALCAALEGRRLLAAVLALGALGDVLLEVAFMAGVVAFAVGHATAILMYLRNRRPLSAGGLAVAVGLLAFALAMPALLLPGNPAAVPFTAYGLLLCAMTAAAWLSRFPRPLTGLGALLFVASDALLAVRMGGGEAPLLGLAIWFLYYFGQLLIFLGVRKGLAYASSPEITASLAARV